MQKNTNMLQTPMFPVQISYSNTAQQICLNIMSDSRELLDPEPIKICLEHG